MKKRQITFWKNTGHEALRGKTVELFKVSWDDELLDWVRNEDGPYWGTYKLGTEEVRRLTRDPNDMGDVTYVEEERSAVEVVKGAVEKMLAADEEERAEEIDHLEAEDISITPEGLDLGEGE